MIHPNAIVSPAAQLGENVTVGPFSVVGPAVTLGDRCVVDSHVVITGPTTIGSDCEFYPFAAIGGKTQDLKYLGEPTGLSIGDRNVFRENTTVHRSTTDGVPTTIGNDNLFLCYSHVAHDCQLGNHIILSNNGTLAGHVQVDDYAIVSGLSAVHQFCRVGAYSMIGGLARIVQDVSPFMIAEGNPAAIRGLNQVGLKRHGFGDDDIRAIKSVYKKLFLKKDGNLALQLDQLRETELVRNVKVAELLAFISSSDRGIVR